MYKALYRKYRPDRFSRVVGQQHIVQTLIHALQNNTTAHAYLFHGPRGTGKTSIAKIFAEALNCENVHGDEIPCHACSSCQQIDEGLAADIIELDAASNNGVDEIRMIRENATYAPTNLQRKVYIIDEVHMLSTAAFNALLKTLEEPPQHVVFILATTEIQKIPMTIISRCQRFDFKNITAVEMKKCLAPIIATEDIAITDEAIEYLVEYANGGMRDLLSALDQAMAYAGDQVIDLDDVLDVTGGVGNDVYIQLIEHILNQDHNKILVLINDVIENGKNVQLFVEEFIQFILLDIEDSLKGEGIFVINQMFALLESANELATKMKTAFLPKIALQAFFLELAYKGDVKHGPLIEGTAKIEEPSISMVPEKTTLETAIHHVIQNEQQKSEGVIANQKETQKMGGLTNENAVCNDDILRENEFLKETEQVEVGDELIDLFSFEPQNDTFNETSSNTSMQDNYESKPLEAMMQDTQALAKAVESEEVRGANEGQAVVESETIDLFETDVYRKKIGKQIEYAMAHVMLFPEKNQLEKVKRKWQTIRFDPVNPVVGMLIDTTPKIATESEIVLSTFNKSLANQLHMEPTLSKAHEYVSELLGGQYQLVFTNEGNWMQKREEFLSKWKNGTVDEPYYYQLKSEIAALELEVTAAMPTIELPDTVLENEAESQIVREARELFGSDMVEVKK